LFKYQPWDYEISLKPGVTLTAILIYSLLKRELKTLREYIEKNIVKRYIRSLKSLIRYSVLFVSKKDEKLRIYVDYRKLNDIIIKNRYTLSASSHSQSDRS
jgi:predicted transport protein